MRFLSVGATLYPVSGLSVARVIHFLTFLSYVAKAFFVPVLPPPAISRTRSSPLSPDTATAYRFHPHRLAASEQEGNEEPAPLFQKLDESFDYEGRLRGSEEYGKDYRCGFVCILGATNMGKSTLLNTLLQEDLCIATARPQTTRHAILGLLTTNTTQVCLVDTPGIIGSPAYKLQEGMMETVVGAFKDADVLLVVTDLFSTPIPDDELFRKVQMSSKPTVVCINKVDLADKVNADSEENQDKTVTIEQAVQVWRQLLPDSVAILPMSASNGPNDAGVVALRRLLCGGPDLPAALRDLGRPIPGMFVGDRYLDDRQAQEILPKSPPLYDQEALTDRTERFIASEIVRASLFESLKKELPYCCEVQITQFKEPKPDDKKKPIIRIEAEVLVERDSQKLIVIGKGGEQIKTVGIAARKKLEEFFQMKIYLDLSVKVSKDWRKSEDKLKKYGYL